MVNGNKTRILALNRPVVSAGDAIAEGRGATTALDKAGNISGAVVDGVIALQTGGGINSSKVNRREAVASATYGKIVGANLDLLGKAVAEAMRSK